MDYRKVLKSVGILLAMVGLCCVTLASAAEETIKIGVVGPRTGTGAPTGKAFEEGIALALDLVNAPGKGVLGKKLEVIFEDTGGDPEKAASGIEKLITKDKVVMVVGESHSSAALAEIDVANRHKVPLVIAEAWHDDITAKGYRYVFRAGPSNSGVVNETLLPFIKENGFKKVAIVAENTDWGLGMKKLAEDGLSEDECSHDDLDYRPKQSRPLHGNQQDQAIPAGFHPGLHLRLRAPLLRRAVQ